MTSSICAVNQADLTLITGGSGFVGSGSDPELSNMSQEQHISIGESGKLYFAENFDPQILVKKLLDIFSKILSKHHRKL